MKSAEVLVHLAQQHPQFAPGDVELLLGLVGPLRLVPGLQLGPQRLAGRLLGLPAPQLLLQLLQTTNRRDGDGEAEPERVYNPRNTPMCLR